ncbi:group II intron maturase-specific domain-containing protein [Flavobacterium piscis]|uniref:group II intron maturase-specific domain-containing protein n=1 Tax=Flavobacterium piscis TaxID=1114874 RepID=UPI0038D432FD
MKLLIAVMVWDIKRPRSSYDITCRVGWVSYFKLADMSGRIKRIDEWLRFRIRMIIWKSWKKISTILQS